MKEGRKFVLSLFDQQMDKERERARFKDELALMGTENDELMSKVDELRNDIVSGNIHLQSWQW